MGLWARKRKTVNAATGSQLPGDDRRRVIDLLLLALTLFIGQMLSDNFHAGVELSLSASLF